MAEADLVVDYCAERTAMMPKRRRTGAQANGIATERCHHRQARLARKPKATTSSDPHPPTTTNHHPSDRCSGTPRRRMP
ncbi:hypothetical protein [Mycobacterium sp. IEC1808]|uniref:hypothetical protein n=1 Tax=Mycobacterium sp. IEC1808 TaxID=1743230 RepID=UPI00114E2CF9|nr:hypothetical protein [Mycobacterium sp. IEC1808]